MIRATVVYLFIGTYLIIMAPVCMAWTALSKNASLIYEAARFCIRAAGWMCGVKVRVRGSERIDSDQNYVFLSNHQGNFDGPVLFHVIPRDLRALIKREMMQLPVLSRVLRQVRFIPIDRTDPVRARENIDRGAELLKEGH